MQADADAIRTSPTERYLIDRLQELAFKSGSHSPSLVAIQEALPDITVDIDACFLANPLATKLFWAWFNADVLENRRLMNQMLEAYPPQNRFIAERFASTIGADPRDVFVANGANEVIQAIIHNYASSIHINVPTYSPYYEFARADQRVTTYKLDPASNFALDPGDYVDSVLKSRADTAVLISPNNPDGYQIPDDHLRWILGKLSALETVIVDESFIHFAGRAAGQGLPTLLNLTEQFSNVALIKSMSKDFGVAGIRAGYAVMNSDLVTELLKHGYLWNINGIAAYFFSLFSRATFLETYRNVLATYLENIAEFNAMMLGAEFARAYPTSANFQLVRLPDGTSADLVAALLLIRHGIYVRSCSDKVGLGGEHLRIAIRTDSENRRVFDALEDVLA